MDNSDSQANDSVEALLGRAALGLDTLSPDDSAAWDRLVAAEPQLEGERLQLELLADTMRLMAPAPVPDAPAVATPIPAATLAALEAARQVAISNQSSVEQQEESIWTRARPEVPKEKSPGVFKRFLQIVLSPGPGLALGATAVLAVGIFLLNRPPADPTGLNQGGDMKSVFAKDIPLASPGVETHFTDPTVLWISLAGEEAQLTIVPSAPGSKQTAKASPPATWAQLGWSALQPGSKATLTLQVNTEKTERAFTTTGDAKPLASWLEDPTAAAAAAQRWLTSHPADSLILLGALAQKSPLTPEQIQWRQQALDNALAESHPSSP